MYCLRSLYAMSNSSVFSSRRKLLKDSADLQLYDSEFQTDGALTLKAFADNAIVSSVVQTVTVYQLIAGCEMGGSF